MVGMVAKISQRSLGDPKKIVATAKETENRWMIGTIIGVATGISRRASPDGEKVHEGLKGTFETIPADKATDAQMSGVLYLPEGMVETFLAPFRGENPPTAMQIAIEVNVIRAKNPQGYSWELTPQLARNDESDPLAELRKAVTGGTIKQLAQAPSTRAKAK